nr:MAG TPA: holin [Caudoviricetes sp.]
MQYMDHLHMLVDNKIVWLFVWIVIADIVTGFLKSLVTKKTSSRKGTDGLIRHGALLLIIITLYPMLDINGFRSAGDALIIFYVLFYAVSIIENLGQMGVPVPDFVKQYICKLSDEYVHEDTNKEVKNGTRNHD